MIKYHDFKVSVFDDNFQSVNKLIKCGTDNSGWRVFFKNDVSNWILFYPFSEYQGGGQPYIVRIESSDFDKWINDNPNFEIIIRQQIETYHNKQI